VLLLALAALRDSYGWEVLVVCVDHQLRQASTNEAVLVQKVAQRLGLAARIMTVQVPHQPSLQAAARSARYEALTEAARSFDSQLVLVAHTRNDQAETVVQRLLGGAGLRGLSGIPPERYLISSANAPSVRLLRPMLSVDRSEVARLLGVANGLVSPLPLLDPSNDDTRFGRALIRHRLLPQLQTLNPALPAHLSTLATQLREDADCLDELALTQLPQVLVENAPRLSGQLAVLSATKLRSLPRALSTRILSQLAGQTLATVHQAALHKLCAHSHGTQSLDLPGGLLAERRYDVLYLLRRPLIASPTVAPLDPLSLPTDGFYEHGPWRLRLRILGPDDDLPKPKLHHRVFAVPAPGFPLWLRPPRPGDRLRLPSGHRKVSDLLIDAKLPRAERSAQLVLGYRDEPLWLIGLRAAIQPPARLVNVQSGQLVQIEVELWPAARQFSSDQEQ